MNNDSNILTLNIKYIMYIIDHKFSKNLKKIKTKLLIENVNNLLLPINYNYMYQKTVPIFIKINH